MQQMTPAALRGGGQCDSRHLRLLSHQATLSLGPSSHKKGDLLGWGNTKLWLRRYLWEQAPAPHSHTADPLKETNLIGSMNYCLLVTSNIEYLNTEWGRWGFRGCVTTRLGALKKKSRHGGEQETIRTTSYTGPESVRMLSADFPAYLVCVWGPKCTLRRERTRTHTRTCNYFWLWLAGKVIPAV